MSSEESRPSGTVTFLFTDIEGSTRAWEERPEEMKALVAQHDEIVRDAIERNDGCVFATGGDGFAAAFQRAGDAVEAARAAQSALADLPDISVRMGLNTGEAHERGGDYFGPPVNRAARLMAAGHGGQVLVAAVTADLVTDVEMRHLGEHRLRDLGRPISIFQTGTDDFPPLRSLDAAPTNLPVQLTSFVGRDTEIDALAALVREHRVVTITGVGGVGKTRLAAHVAAEVLPECADGVWLAELAAADTAESMIEVVAATLNVSVRGTESLAGSIVEAIRSTQMLVVLDNCEHLLLDVADLVDEIVARSSNVRVLATSREGLGVDGERVWPLRSLGVPKANDALDAVAASASVRLLLDRAQAADPAFALDATNRAAVTEICRQLDGIPLAIELAAARLTAMQPQEIAAHLDERFRLLTGGKRRGIERHQTLRATVDWSYSLLGDRERHVFDRLAVFAGGFDAAAAHSVVADLGLDRLDLRDALEELVAKSMLVADPGVGGETRYSLLETLRQYGLERLDERDESDLTRRHHAAYFAGFAEMAAPGLISRHELEWRPRVRAEVDNFRAAVTWALDRDDPADGELAMRIVAAMAVEAVLDRGSGLGTWAEQAIGSWYTVGSPHRPMVLVAAAYGAFHRLANDEARRYLDLADADPSEPLRYGMAEAIRANLALPTKDAFVEGARIAGTAVGMLEGDDEETLAARLLLCPAPIYAVLAGERDAAAEMADRLLADARRLGQPTGLAIALYVKGLVLYHLGTDPDGVVAALEESIAITRAGASDVILAQALISLAIHRSMLGDHINAVAALREAIAHSTSAGDQVSNCSAMSGASVALAVAGVDDVAAICMGAGRHGFLAHHYFDEAYPGVVEVFAALEARIDARRWDELIERGAAMEYEGLLELVVAALDDALAARRDDVSLTGDALTGGALRPTA